MEDSVLYEFATRQFRDVADSDYITSRLCYRNNLSIQFLWMAEQAIEKYLKAILLYNKMKTGDISHKLINAIERIEKVNSFDFELSDESREFIKHINEVGMNRYFSTFVLSSGNLLHSLDKAVFELRLYCNVTFETHRIGPFESTKITSYNSSNDEIKKLIYSNKPNDFRLDKGFLEKVIDNNNDIKRESLVWHNVYYGHPPDDININNMPFEFKIPPSIRFKEHFNEIQKYIRFNTDEKKYIEEYIDNNKE